MKRTLPALFALSVLVLLLAGCVPPANAPATSATAAPAAEAAAATGAQKLIWAVEGVNELPGLDPANPQNAQSIQAINLIFGGLVKLDGLLNVVPDGAESWTVSEDGTVYTFKIRDGLQFPDNTPVTAQTFADSINRALQPETASYGASFQLGHIVGANDVAAGTATEASGIMVLDPSTLEITLDANVPYFLAQLTYPVSFAVPFDAIAKDPTGWTETAFGTGPFRVKEWQHNQKLILEPNPTYWAGAPTIGTVELPFFQDSETSYQLYRTGGLDISGSQQNPVPSARVPEVKDGPDFHSAASFAVRYVGFNNKLAPFDDVNVRRAFALAVDKQTLASAVLNDAVAPTDRLLPPGFTGSQLAITGIPFDPTQAKQALADAGFDASNPFPQVSFTYGVEGDNERVATFLQQQWKENLGVDVVLEPLELATFSKALDTTYVTPEEGVDFYLSIWGADYPDPQNFVSQQLRSDSPNNNGHWENAQFDELATQADTFLGTPEERLQLYNQAEQIAVDEVGWLPLYVPQFSVLISPAVTGYSLTGQGLIFPDWSKVTGRAE